jgi:hypothetical protein
MKACIYPGKTFRSEVIPLIEDDDGDMRPPTDTADAEMWAVHSRPQPEGLAMWVADFQSETDAREYAAWRAGRS